MAPSPGGFATPSNFNPLGLQLLSSNLREELDRQPRIPLDAVEKFSGAGLYALYYKGDLPLYERLKSAEVPIYVGKAEAGNSSYGDPPNESEPKLLDRIKMHRRSINQASNLDASHFDVRYLVLDDIWIVLGERALLRVHSPVLWNTLMPGFGSNAAGEARTNGRSIWDSIHPGRRRAKKFFCNRKYTRAEMENIISDGIDISLEPLGPQRDAALAELRSRTGTTIWSAPKNDDKRYHVYRADEFLEENKHFGIEVSAEYWQLADESEEGGQASVGAEPSDTFDSAGSE